MSSIDILSQKVKEIQEMAYKAQHPLDVGASYGVIYEPGVVQAGKEFYSVSYACDAPDVKGTPVWFQKTAGGMAVVIGEAL